MSSNQPDDRSGEVNGGQEVVGSFVVTSGDGAILLELGEEVFDQVSSSIECAIPFSTGLTPSSRRNDRVLARGRPRVDHAGIRVIAFVGDQLFRLEHREQDVGAIEIAGLPAAEVKAQWIAQRIDCGVNLGAQPAFAAADGLRAVFLRAPALC